MSLALKITQIDLEFAHNSIRRYQMTVATSNLVWVYNFENGKNTGDDIFSQFSKLISFGYITKLKNNQHWPKTGFSFHKVQANDKSDLKVRDKL